MTDFESEAGLAAQTSKPSPPGADRDVLATQRGRVGPASFPSEASATLQPMTPVPPGVGRTTDVNLENIADPDTIRLIRENWRQRQAWHRAEKSLTLQCKAICRRFCGGSKPEANALFKSVTKTGEPFDVMVAISPLYNASLEIEKQRKAIEKRLIGSVETLPIAPWVKSVRGISLNGFVGIVGEAGDIGSYKSVSALWKRMGLAVINGERQRKMPGADALIHGYSPQRRSVMWNIGENFVKQGDEFKKLYDERKVYELTKTDRPIVAHSRAKRYIEKRFLREAYAHWRNGG